MKTPQRAIPALLALCLLAHGPAASAQPTEDPCPDPHAFFADLSGAQELNPPGGVQTDAIASFTASFGGDYSAVVVTIELQNAPNIQGAHLHCAPPGANGPIALGFVNPGPCNFDGESLRCILDNNDLPSDNCNAIVGRPVNNIAALASAMRDGLIYVNLHTADNPAGELRGQIEPGFAKKDCCQLGVPGKPVCTPSGSKRSCENASGGKFHANSKCVGRLCSPSRGSQYP